MLKKIIKEYVLIIITILLFLLLIFLKFLNEIADLPHVLFNFQQTPINYPELAMESIFTLIIGLLMIIFMRRFLIKRKRYELNLKQALAEREILFKESNHRIKNNLNMIASIIDLQSASSNSDEMNQTLENLRKRIISIGLIHEKLSLASHMKTISANEYFPRLLEEITFTATKKINLSYEIDQIYFKPERLVHLAIITTELVINAMKYAFEKEEHPTIYFVLKKVQNNYLLYIKNNGSSLPEHFSLDNHTSLGMNLLKILIVQISGKLEVKQDPLTEFRITFPG